VRLLNALRRMLVCSWRGHRPTRHRLIYVDRPIVLRGGEVIVGDDPELARKVRASKVVVYTICARCGEVLEG